MQKKNIRNLYLISLGVLVLGAACMLGSLYGGTYSTVTDSCCKTHVSGSPGNVPLFIIGAIIAGGACISIFVAYVMSLIKMAQRQQWAWFVVTLVLNIISFVLAFFPGIIWSFFPDAQPLSPYGSLPDNSAHT
jgi:MFS family permease